MNGLEKGIRRGEYLFCLDGLFDCFAVRLLNGRVTQFLANSWTRGEGEDTLLGLLGELPNPFVVRLQRNFVLFMNKAIWHGGLKL